jgi:CDP-paratose 2-epimerase
VALAIVTGSSGLVGSSVSRYFHDKGFDIAGLDNDQRAAFFGASASTRPNRERLESTLKRYVHHSLDIRDREAIEALFRRYGKDIHVVIHAAAQPSHDWAAKAPYEDFSINALATLYLLEAARTYCPEAVFIFCSTNKVYGDTPNRLPFVECDTRWELAQDHPFAECGIDESMSVDNTLHSLFGVSKLSADALVGEYGKYFGMKTGVFRGGCITGGAHAGAQLHGFLAYLVRCAAAQATYQVFGYGGKQVRDNIHADDLARMFWHFFEDPDCGVIYNVGGSRHSNCSLNEALAWIAQKTKRQPKVEYHATPRKGDHIWWITDIRKFRGRYPKWEFTHTLESILDELLAMVSSHT